MATTNGTRFKKCAVMLTCSKLISFIAEVLNVYKRFHKHTQSDKLTIVSLAKYIDSLKNSLEELKRNDAIGSWAEQLKLSLLA